MLFQEYPRQRHQVSEDTPCHMTRRGHQQNIGTCSDRGNRWGRRKGDSSEGSKPETESTAPDRVAS